MAAGGQAPNAFADDRLTSFTSATRAGPGAGPPRVVGAIPWAGLSAAFVSAAPARSAHASTERGQFDDEHRNPAPQPPLPPSGPTSRRIVCPWPVRDGLACCACPRPGISRNTQLSRYFDRWEPVLGGKCRDGNSEHSSRCDSSTIPSAHHPRAKAGSGNSGARHTPPRAFPRGSARVARRPPRPSPSAVSPVTPLPVARPAPARCAAAPTQPGDK